MLPAAGDRDQLIGAARELGSDVVDDQLNVAVFSNHLRQHLGRRQGSGFLAITTTCTVSCSR